ncbi:hypothetical protein D3C78_1108780 [compost metagenome]
MQYMIVCPLYFLIISVVLSIFSSIFVGFMLKQCKLTATVLKSVGMNIKSFEIFSRPLTSSMYGPIK